MEYLHNYLMVGFAGIFLLFVVVSRRRAARRLAGLEEAAVRNGWTFEPGDTALDPGEFPLFDRGRRRRAHNALRGSSGRIAFAAFDYRYTIGSGKSTRTLEQTVVSMQSPGLALPAFVLSPENILHKIGGVFGYHDIDFESSPEFSSQYLLRCPQNEQAVRELFSPAVCEYLQRHKGLTVEGGGDRLLVYRAGRLVAPDQMRDFVELALSVTRLFER